MELIEKLKFQIEFIKMLEDQLDAELITHCTTLILEALSELCDGAGETQWTIKDQIQIAIEELNN